ncbi:hypothetical protein [Lysinibacillus sp. 3P01SB]|uniref:hypothetical protein n=1 Tax=Lysinibacillus sp. 3P01SB TaxID=3132284 RepID=UPI0039A477F4
MNEWQRMLYDFMYSLPLADQLKDELHKCIVATKMNDVRDFVNAKDILTNIFRDIANGTLTITSTLRAIFTGAYGKDKERIKRPAATSAIVEDNVQKERPVPFYDWLIERESS